MESCCIICDGYVDLTSNSDTQALKHTSNSNEGLVCDGCFHNKLNSGTPLKDCLYCEKEADYYLQKYGVEKSHDGPMIFAKQGRKPMICEDDFEKLKEDNKRHTLSIDNTLTSESQLQSPDVSIPAAIGQDENKHLEYKETFQYAVYDDKQDKSLKSKVAKEVAAFGNSEGGVVVIGVDDSKRVTGLQRDYRSMEKERDGFALEVSDVISSNIGPEFAAEYISTEFYEIDGKDIFAIHVNPSPSPLFTADNSFYVRQESSSRPLDTEEAMKYKSNHW